MQISKCSIRQENKPEAAFMYETHRKEAAVLHRIEIGITGKSFAHHVSFDYFVSGCTLLTR